MSESDVVVVAVARTPFGRFQGLLSELDGPTLGAKAVDEVLRRAGVPGDAVDALYGGVGLLASAVLTPVRQAVLLSALSSDTPSAAIDRACCSGMTAVAMGYKDLRLGEAEVVVCGGFESLSSTPFLLPRQRRNRIGGMVLDDPLVLRGKSVPEPIAVYTGEEALRFGVDRQQQDRWALESHQRYWAAQAHRHFEFERFAVDCGDKSQSRICEQDESPRTDTSLERLASLEPVYGGKTVTAGNAPTLSDGAAFLMMCRRGFAVAHGLEPLGQIVDYVQVSGSATSGTSTPAVAIQELQRRNALSPSDWDLIEINEAYAATPLVSTLVLAEGDSVKAGMLRQRTNAYGGAVAMGHPLGASGARLVMTLINGLRARGGGRGVAAICGGFGQGDGMVVEVG